MILIIRHIFKPIDSKYRRHIPHRNPILLIFNCSLNPFNHKDRNASHNFFVCYLVFDTQVSTDRIRIEKRKMLAAIYKYTYKLINK